MIKAHAAFEAGGTLQPFEYDPGPLGRQEVEIDVESCGICHSDLSMLDNEWGRSQFPLVPGHEVVGTIAQLGEGVAKLKLGQRVGLGWHSGYCLSCPSCMEGDHNLCASAQGSIVGRHGGFADKVRAQASSVVPLPAQLDSQSSGPLFCGGITVFNPLVQFAIPPTAKAAAGQFDLILSTVNVKLDWNAYMSTLKPRGRLHFVGATLEPLDIGVFSLIGGQRTISGSPVGSPATIARMLEFAARHEIRPVTEIFRFDQVNEAVERLRSGQARYRVVLSR